MAPLVVTPGVKVLLQCTSSLTPAMTLWVETLFESAKLKR